ncbi:MAG: PAS domain S-box protein, partial [Chloroflexales bacterium]|nr:PAS domain S-box protein [Chloroflexales bacterium]
MQWLELLAVAVLVVVAVLALGLAAFAARRQHTTGARTMAVMDIALAVWALAYAAELMQPSFAAKVLCTKLVYVGVVLTPLAWFLFAARFTGSDGWLTRRTLVLLALVPLITLCLVWTNEAHGLVWSELRLATVQGVSTLDSRYGPWFFVHAAFSYLLLLAGSLLILRSLLYAGHIQRRQSLVLLVGVVAPWVGNALHLLRLSPIYPLDLTPFMFGVSALSFGWSLVRLRMLDVVPVAYNTVVVSMDDALIVLDEQGRVANMNPAAERLLGQSAAKATGQPARQVLAALPALLAQHNAHERAEAALTLDGANGRRRYAATIVPLRDRRERHAGQV